MNAGVRLSLRLAAAALLFAGAASAYGEGVARKPRRERAKPAEAPASSEPSPAPPAAEGGVTDLKAFLATLPETADGRRLLTLDRVLDIVLHNHLRIRIAARRYLEEAADVQEEDARFDPSLYGRLLRGESRVPTANAFANPVIRSTRDDQAEVGVSKTFHQGLELSSSLRASRFGTNSSFQGLVPEYDTFLGLSAVQPLLQGGGDFVNTAPLRTARLEAQAERDRYRAEVERVTAGTEILYWQLVGSLEVLRIRQESLDRVRTLLDDTRQRLKAGIVPISEVRQAEAAEAARLDDLTRARREVERVVDLLATNLRVSGEVKVWELPVRTEDLPAPPEEVPEVEGLLREAERERPEVSAASRDQEVEGIEAEASRRELKPRLDLVADVDLVGISGGAVTFTDFNGEDVRSPFGGPFNEGLDRLVAGDFRDWSLSLEVTYPLGNRAARARHARELHEAREADLERQRVIDDVRHDVLSAHKDLVAARERARVTARFQDLASQALEDEEARLTEGLSDNFHVLRLQDDLSDAGARHVSALVEVQTAQVALAVATGRYMDSRGLDIGEIVLPEVNP